MGALVCRTGMRSQVLALAVVALTAGCCLASPYQPPQDPQPANDSETIPAKGPEYISPALLIKEPIMEPELNFEDLDEEAMTCKLKEGFEKYLRRTKNPNAVDEHGQDYSIGIEFDYELYQNIVDFMPKIVDMIKSVGGAVELPVVTKIGEALEAAVEFLKKEDEGKKGNEKVEEDVEEENPAEENVEKVGEEEKVEDGADVAEEKVEDGADVAEEKVEEETTARRRSAINRRRNINRRRSETRRRRS